MPAVSVNLNGPRGVTWVHVLHGQWLLTAASDSSLSELSLWSLSDVFSSDSDLWKPVPATTAFLDGPVAHGLVEAREGCVAIVLEIRTPCVIIVISQTLL